MASIEQYVETGRAAWPELCVAEHAFTRCVAERAAAGDALPIAHAGDLLLACACAQRVPLAIEAFHRLYDPVIRRVLARRGATDDMMDEVKQIVFDRLFVAQAGKSAKVSGYRGAGALRSWVATVAATSLLMLRRVSERRREDLESSFLDKAIASEPELGYLKSNCKPAVEAAVVRALARLDDRQRALLRLHLGERMGIDQLGAMYRVNRATAARWLSAARQSLAAFARDELRSALRLSESECESVLGLVQSALDVSVLRHLAPSARE